MQGLFNDIKYKSRMDVVNAAINYFHDKRGDGVENPDQIRFIFQFLQSMDSMGSDILLLSNQNLQPTVFISDLILYNLPIGISGEIIPRLQIFLKSRNKWDIVYNLEWNNLQEQHITTFHRSFGIHVHIHFYYDSID